MAAQTDCTANPAVEQLLYDRRVLSSLPDIIAVLDREHRIQYINRVVPGRTVAEFIGASVLDYLPEDERELRREALERAWNMGKSRRSSLSRRAGIGGTTGSCRSRKMAGPSTC
ncbi:MAG: PAS domain-containing protein [Polyangiaceae bacterium]|nr:PAS domain-containing protein [Polyangiaceae bacterium]